MTDENPFLAARKRLGWTQHQAAGALGVKQPTIVNWERDVIPSPQHWDSITREYGISRRRLERMFLKAKAA